MKTIRVICAGALLLLAGLVQAAPVSFTANLTGPAESPPNASPGTGSALIVFDTTAHTLSVQVNFSGLQGVTTVAHIHCCTATPGVANSGVATEQPTFGAFPVGVSSGTYNNVFDMTQVSSFGTAFLNARGGDVALAEQDLFNGSVQGRSYLNVHSSLFPGGEIRGFLQQAVAVPLPSSLLLLGLGFAGIGLTLRKK